MASTQFPTPVAAVPADTPHPISNPISGNAEGANELAGLTSPTENPKLSKKTQAAIKRAAKSLYKEQSEHEWENIVTERLLAEDKGENFRLTMRRTVFKERWELLSSDEKDRYLREGKEVVDSQPPISSA